MTMKRRSAAALLLTGVLLSAGAAAPGSAEDPLIALNWLTKTFLPGALTAAEDEIDTRTEDVYQGALEYQIGGGVEETRVKRGDILRMETGSSLTVLAGTLSGSSDGTIVNVTTGTELKNWETLSGFHRYITAEKTTAIFSVTSDTAVVQLAGMYHLNASNETDYNALADALCAMGLFRGSDISYGSGYALENQPTRIEGLILFLRLLGEENDALKVTDGSALSDVPEWAVPYVAYAYQKGYTKGVGKDKKGKIQFRTDTIMTAPEYMTFLLRALGYKEKSDFNWNTSISDAVKLGVLTQGEKEMLAQKTFLRAQTVYLSYYALAAPVKGGKSTLLGKLTASGALNQSIAAEAISRIEEKRL